MPKKRQKRRGWRLSDVDVHYLVGFLYVITRRDDSVVLGERVRDVTTGTERDVDIVVSGGWGLLGVEVKDKGRPLDVGIVEGICQKLNDMPTLTERAIVSSSDYTESARKKAAAHNVKCLRFVRGTIPTSFEGTDLSSLRSMTLRHARWTQPPRVTVTTTSGEAFGGLPWSTRFIADDSGGPRTLGEMTEKMPDKIQGPSGTVDCDVVISYPLKLARRGEPSVARIHFEGDLAVTHSSTPLRTTCYLADEDGDALAAIVLFDYGDSLTGVATTPAGRISRIPISAEVRRRRPYRAPIR